MQICDLKQEQCKRLIKTGSNELYKHAQCCRCHQNSQEYQKYGLNPNSLNFE